MNYWFTPRVVKKNRPALAPRAATSFGARDDPPERRRPRSRRCTNVGWSAWSPTSHWGTWGDHRPLGHLRVDSRAECRLRIHAREL